MLVASWSNLHGQACTTSNLLATTLACSLVQRKKCLLTQTHYKLNNLDHPLIGRNNELEDSVYYRDLGIDALMRRAKSSALTKEIVEECSISVLDKYLSLLIGTKQQDKASYITQFNAMLEGVLISANQFYDFVMVDTNSGNDKITQQMLKQADIILVNLSQNKHIIDNFFEEHVHHINLNKVIFLFGTYDKKSRYNLKNLRRMYKLLNANNSVGIPYCTEFHDALSDGKTLKFIERNISADEDDENFEFIHAIKEVSELINMKATKERTE